MNSKFMDLLNRLFNRIEKDSEKTEQAITELQKGQHKNDLDIKKIAVLPKKTCTARFEKLEAKNEEIIGRLPNDREIKKADYEDKELKKNVKKNSTSLLRIFFYVIGFVAAVGFIATVLKLDGKT